LLDQGGQESSADVATCAESCACKEVLPGAEVEEVGEVPYGDDGEPKRKAQREVKAKLPNVEMNVIVQERFTSPLNIAVQKFDWEPPGELPSRRSPSRS